jgi:PAS domain S-box-containing protein
LNGYQPVLHKNPIYPYPPPEQLRRFFDVSPDVICIFDREGRFTSVSPSCRNIWGYSPSELLGVRYIDLVLPEDRAATEQIAAAIMQGAVITAFENRYRRSNGNYIHMMWSANWDDAEGCMYCIARDASVHRQQLADEADERQRMLEEQQRLIEHQKETEEELRRSNERFLLAARTDAIYDWDILTGHLHWGEGLHTLFGYHSEELQMPEWEARVHPDDHDRIMNGLQVTLADTTADIWEASYQIRHRNGGWRYVFEKGFIQRGADGAAQRMVGRMQDITAIRMSELERRKLGEQMRGQNETMGAVLEQLHVGLVTINAEGLVTFWNSEAERITGRSRSSIVGKPFLELYPNMAGNTYGELYARLLHDGGHLTQEVQSPYNKRWVEIQGYMTGGKVSFLFKDISSRKRYEDERQKLSLIAQQTSNAVLLLNAQYQVTWINPAYTRVFGYTAEEAVGHSAGLIAGPDTDPALTKQFCQDMEAGREFRGEFITYTRDGRRVNAEITAQPVLAADGSPLYYFVMARDTTRRMEREQEFRKLSLITQETDDGIIVTDAQKRTTWINDGFTRMTGFTLDDMRGHRPVNILQGPEPDPSILVWIEEQYALKKPFSFEVLNYKKDGTPFWSLLSIQPLFDEQGNIIEYFSIRKDITSRKQLEQELISERNKTTAAVIAAQEKERSAVSQELHDNVNQVLTTVKLYQELCLSGIGNRDELTRKSMALLQDSINEIRSLSKRLSAPSLGKIRLHESIRELTDAVTATGKLEVKLDTAAIESYEADSTTHITIYRILQEQLTNVLKHAGAQSVAISFELTDQRILLTVTDDGVGFDSTQRMGGSGITNIWSRAESLHGSALLRSAPGKGCTLIVELPREQSH